MISWELSKKSIKYEKFKNDDGSAFQNVHGNIDLFMEETAMNVNSVNILMSSTSNIDELGVSPKKAS